ncbi:MAG: carbohydrate ABC transporter permease, partial [Anaerolineae bacterium]
MKSVKASYFNIDDPRRLGLLLIIPTMLGVLTFLAFPVLYSLYLSFMNYDLKDPTGIGFTGLGNYVEFLTDIVVIKALWRTIVFSFVSVTFEIILGVGMALVLNQKFKGRGLMRGMIILPWALPTVVNAVMWRWIYNPRFGALNALLTQLGIISKYQAWLADPFFAMAGVILANVWKETPFTIMMVLAALQGIPVELYEAAKVDGATAWQTLTRITLRLLMPVIMICALLQVIWSFQAFDLIYVITSGGPYGATEIIPYRIYLNVFKHLDFGYGAAIAYLAMFLLLIPS